MKKKPIISVVVIALLLGGALATAFFAFGPGGGAPPEAGAGETGEPGRAASAVPVTVAESLREDIAGAVEFNGEVEAATRVSLFPEVGGTVTRMEISEGERVSAEEAVIFVDPSRPGSEFQESPVRSPIEGVVVEISTEIGAEVARSSSLATVATTGDVSISVEVPERYAAVVQRGMTGVVSAYAGGENGFEAVVTSVEPQVDAETRSKTVILEPLRGAPTLQPGMAIRAALPVDRAQEVVTVPFEALVQEGGERYLYVVEEGAARRLTVRTGIIAGDRVEIRSGLGEAAQVIVEGHQRLRPGRPVEVTNDPDEAEGASQ
jgi:multidrug efflux pump subunit AcrA (membrane-fusion protein)